MKFLRLLWYMAVGAVGIAAVKLWVNLFGESRPDDVVELKEYVATYKKNLKGAWQRRNIFYARREQFHEWRSRRWEVQFFEPRLWRWGWRWSPQVGYTQADSADPNSPCIRPVPKGWALALPTLSIRKF